MVFDTDPINLIGILVALALLYQSVRLVRKRKESVFEFLIWVGFGMVLLIYSLEQTVTLVGTLELVEKGLSLLGFGGGIEGTFVIAILGILLMLFYTYVNAKTNRQKIADLNQEIALLEYEFNQRYDGEKNRIPEDDPTE